MSTLGSTLQAHSTRASIRSPCTLAGWRPVHIPFALPAKTAASKNPWGEDAPGTGSRHFPEQTAGSARDEEDRQRGFEMRSTAEVYELFEKLQRGQQRQSGSRGDGQVKFRRGGEDGTQLEQPEALRSGPLTGRRRRPGVVNSVDPEEDAYNHFDMRSTAEVYAIFEQLQSRREGPLPVEPHADGDCHAG